MIMTEKIIKKYDLSNLVLEVRDEDQKADVAQIQEILRGCSGVYFDKRSKLTGSAKTAFGHLLCEELGFPKPVVEPKKDDNTHGGAYFIFDYSKTKHFFAGIETDPVKCLTKLPVIAHHALNVGESTSDVISRANDGTKASSAKKSIHPMQDFLKMPKESRVITYYDPISGKDITLDFSNLKGKDDLAVLVIGFHGGNSKIKLLEGLIHDYNENTSFHRMRFLIAQISGSAEFESLGDKQRAILLEAREQYIAGESSPEQFNEFLRTTGRELWIMSEEMKARESLTVSSDEELVLSIPKFVSNNQPKLIN